MASRESFTAGIGSAETVIHLAGQNRGSESEVYETNLELAHLLVQALDSLGTAPALLFANSTHSLGQSAFGRSKREASTIFGEWANHRKTRFVDVILPHVFGEGGRPFYNSGFATFCHQLAHGDEPEIITNGELQLIHAQRVARQFLELAGNARAEGVYRAKGTPMRVSEALDRLKTIHRTYQDGLLPSLADPLQLEFFNTYRSYLFPDYYPVQLDVRADPRGELLEAVKTRNGGQAFLSTTRPGMTRGRHYHWQKFERFLVIAGEAEIRVRRLFEDHVKVFKVSGNEPGFIDIPTFHSHEITNTGDRDLLTLFWSHEIYNASNPDTYPEPVILEP